MIRFCSDIMHDVSALDESVGGLMVGAVPVIRLCTDVYSTFSRRQAEV